MTYMYTFLCCVPNLVIFYVCLGPKLGVGGDFYCLTFMDEKKNLEKVQFSLQGTIYFGILRYKSANKFQN